MIVLFCINYRLIYFNYFTLFLLFYHHPIPFHIHSSVISKRLFPNTNNNVLFKSLYSPFKNHKFIIKLGKLTQNFSLSWWEINDEKLRVLRFTVCLFTKFFSFSRLWYYWMHRRYLLSCWIMNSKFILFPKNFLCKIIILY